MSQPTTLEIVPRSLIRRIFFSELGLRPGWSLTLFLLIYAALTLATQLSFATIPALRDWSARQPHGAISPVGQIEFTGLELMLLLASIAVTGKVERRSFRDYGLSALVAVCFGMLGVLSLQRTGNLWFIIGTHATFDWSIAFFYSTPIAGQPAQGHLLQATPGGPDWLSGGHAGPVGSVIAFAVFALGAVVIHFTFPKTENKATDA